MPMIKVFESGNYSQGEFGIDRVKKIFSKTKDNIKAIFSHTSKWNGKKPLELGEFKEFKVKEENGKAVVYGNVDFNEKGNEYYQDDILKGVSVEIDSNKNELKKIAVLPIGINPAVKGAEFEKMDVNEVILEFEEEIKDNTEIEKDDNKEKDNVKDFSIDDVISKFGADYEIKKKEEKKTKTEEEIRAEIKAEFEAKENAKNGKNEFLKKYKDKITPSIKEFMTDEVLETLYSDNHVLEFNENKVDTREIIEKLMCSLPNIKTDEISQKLGEFEDIEDEYTKQFRLAKEKTEKMNKK
ncbi:hypothetical protein [Streptobacillus moniliformis]|uniref:hypothetical protein n=1 Tax=Streptobacillus moniliformis TaxID=34105 RepID=UPI0007E3C31C|nr:hypothetical protein [Streptobacillus moniliformis]